MGFEIFPNLNSQGANRPQTPFKRILYITPLYVNLILLYYAYQGEQPFSQAMPVLLFPTWWSDGCSKSI